MIFKNRIIPTFIIDKGDLYHTKKFNNSIYLGDPINAVNIFNSKIVYEIIIIDKTETNKINYDILKKIALQCNLPISYGGGIKNLNQIEKIIRLGFEKVVINGGYFKNFDFVKNASKLFGSQSINICIDYFFKNNFFYVRHTKKELSFENFVNLINRCFEDGAGEVILQNTDRNGTAMGYDFENLKEISTKTYGNIIALGGAKDIDDFQNLFNNTNVAGAAASSIFFLNEDFDSPMIRDLNFKLL